MSVQTKEVPNALGALLKAKGQSTNTVAIARQPVATIVENQHQEVPATPAQNPEIEVKVTEQVTPPASNPATPAQNPEPANEGRDSKAYRELKQYHDKTIYEERQKNKQLEEALSKATKPIVQAPKTADELKQFREQYPEPYDIMRTIVLEELGNSNVSVREQLQEVTKAQTQLREQEAFKNLLKEHPDADEIRKDPKFAAWFNEQPDDIKNILATSTDVRAISKQLTLYKLEVLGINPKEKKKAEAQAAVDASLGVTVTGHTEINPQKKVWTGSEIKAISADYKKWLVHKDEIDAARKENRVDWSK